MERGGGPGAPSGGAPGPRWSRLTVPQAVAAAAAVALLVVWVASGSFVFAVLVLILLGAAATLAVLLAGWAGRGPHDGEDHLPDALPTADLAPPAPTERVRRALRGLLSRPWVRGDGLVRAATARLASEDAMVWTPRGQRVAAPHLWLEWNAADVIEVGRRWPLEVLADELLAGYLEHVRSTGARRLTERTWLHVLASADVPVGRVVVTAAFSRPQETPLVSTSGPDQTPRPAPARGSAAVPGIPGATSGSAGRRAPTVAGSAVLVAITPGVADVPLTRPATVLGRDPHADAVVDHPGVSWRHLTLTRRDARTWTVSDTGSTNGTLIGGRRIAGLGVLHEGDTLALGHDGPRFRLALAPVPASAPRPTPTRREGTRLEVA